MLLRRRRAAKLVEALFNDRAPHLEIVYRDGRSSDTRSFVPDMYDREVGLDPTDFAADFLSNVSASPSGPSTWTTTVPEIDHIIARNFTGEQVGKVNELLSMT